MNDFKFDKMSVEYVYAMRNWGLNSDPLLESYDFWPKTKAECDYWHMVKTKKDDSKYFVYIKGQDVVCYLSIKKINQDEKSSVLGLVMNPNYQGHGYGYKIMKDFLNKYFSWGFLSMSLSVACFNRRAIALYEKLGYKYRHRSYSLFDGKKESIDDDRRKYFIFLPGIVICKNYIMEIGR